MTQAIRMTWNRVNVGLISDWLDDLLWWKRHATYDCKFDQKTKVQQKRRTKASKLGAKRTLEQTTRQTMFASQSMMECSLFVFAGSIFFGVLIATVTRDQTVSESDITSSSGDGSLATRVYQACELSAPIVFLIVAGSFGLSVSLLYLQRLVESQSKSCKDNKGCAQDRLQNLESKLMHIIQSRRSVFPKDYNGRGVQLTSAHVQTLLEAAHWAPSHKRTEPWRFKVLQGQSTLELKNLTLAANKANTSKSEYLKMQEWFTSDWEKEWSKCDAMIVIGMTRDERVPEWEEVAAVGCAVQNLHLMATALGIAGYWSSWNPIARESKEMKGYLGVDRCLGVFMLASSDRISSYKSRRKSLSELTL